MRGRGLGATLGLAAFVGLWGVSRGFVRSAVAAPAREARVLTRTHGLGDLALLEATLYRVEESYAVPKRVNHEAMYVAAMEAVEAAIPAALFRRDLAGEVVQVEINDFRTTLAVPAVANRRALQYRIEQIGALLGAHLGASDIPGEWSDPWARIEYVLVNGALSTLDPHSMLLPPEDAREMDIGNDGAYGGLGFTVTQQDGRLIVDQVRPGDPADLAGILSGDEIARVDGESMRNLPSREALRRIRGPIGSTVALQVRRRGDPGYNLHVQRARITPDEVTSELQSGRVALIRVPSFHEAVGAEVRAALREQTDAAGALRGVILDLRGNPGGYLTQAVEVADTFLSSGMVVSTVNGDGEREPPMVAHEEGTEPNIPVVVLMDADAASASEIVAGALRNNGRAVILGERSFGKGSVQNLWPFPDGSKLKLTIARYLTPGDVSIQGVGVPADVEVVPVLLGGGDDEDLAVRLAWRERVRREVDLARSLDAGIGLASAPAARVVVRSDGDASQDAEVTLAHALIVGTRRWRREDVLADGARTLARAAEVEESTVVAALAERGVDWSDGPAVTHAEVQVTAAIGEGRALQPGVPTAVTLTVTNHGDASLYRLLGVASSPDEALDGLEWAFGAVAPGASRAVTRRVTLPVGFTADSVPLTLALRDTSELDVAEVSVSLRSAPAALPQLAWSWTPVDLGDGDGLVEVGETWALDVTVNNVGEGATVQPFVRLHPKARGVVDLVVATTHPGVLTAAEGETCDLLAPGWDGQDWVGDGEPMGAPGDYPPKWSDGCRRVIAPGASATTRVSFAVQRVPREGVAVELAVGDAVAFDDATVVQGGHWDTFSNATLVTLPSDRVATAGHVAPPHITVSRRPPTQGSGPLVTVSGVVADDKGVASVVVFADDDKVFFAGADTVRALPFTATVERHDVPVVITVIATDTDGLTSTVTMRSLPDEG